MESRYGIGINNRYAMFLDSEDGEDLILPKKKAVTEAKDQPMLNKVEAKTAQPVKKVVPEDPKLVKSQTPTKPNQKTNTREGKIHNFFHVKKHVGCKKIVFNPIEGIWFLKKYYQFLLRKMAEDRNAKILQKCTL